MKVEVWKKRKILSVMSAVLLIVSLLVNSGMETWASEGVPMLDGSYLTHESESIGYSTKVTRGESLQAGYSKLVRLGPGVIYAGGTTLAQNVVESVQVAVVVERAKNAQDYWHYVTDWRQENKNADGVTANRRLEVEGGWYYRVTSIHSAGSDISSSFTDGLFIEEP